MDDARKRKEEAAAAAAAPRAAVAAARPAAPAAGSGSSVPSAAGENRPLNSTAAPITTLAEAKQRLQRIQEAAIQQAQQGGTAGHASGHSVSSKPALDLQPLAFGSKPASGSGQQQQQPGAEAAAAAGPRFGVPTALAAAGAGPSSAAARAGSVEPQPPVHQTYEISPYK